LKEVLLEQSLSWALENLWLLIRTEGYESQVKYREYKVK
jgi:hypothetical protein